jgi:pyrophosphate--fructose-6-phosphate 1-phosphotransferase
VSRIETEELLIEMVTSKMLELKNDGKFKGKFSTQHHFLGYEGRSAFPSNFDANYCYALGYNACILIKEGLSGYMSAIRNLARPVNEWKPSGIPLTMLMNLEQRSGRLKPVVKKAFVNLNGKPFRTFLGKRDQWAIKTSFISPGPIQFYGPDYICNLPSKTLHLEHEERKNPA